MVNSRCYCEERFKEIQGKVGFLRKMKEKET